MLGYSHAPASRLNSTDSFNTVLVVIPSVVVRLEVRRSAFGVPFCSPKSVIFDKHLSSLLMPLAQTSAIHTRKTLPKLVLEASLTHGKVTKGIKRRSQEIVKHIILVLRAGDLLFQALKDTLTIIRD